MEIDNKLKHLDDEQISYLVSDYENSEIKLKDIIEKYRLDCTTRGIRKLLPLKVLNEQCEYCGENLRQKVRSRSSYNEEEKECVTCGHKIKYGYWGCNCRCQGCIDKEISKINQKREVIRDYLKNFKPNRNLQFSNLDLKDQVILYNLIISNDLSFEQLNSIDNLHRYKYNEKANISLKDYEYLAKKKIISISDRTPIEAFDGDEIPYTINYHEVEYDINVDFTDAEKMDVANKKYNFQTEDYNESILDMYKEFLYRDSYYRFSEMLDERNLSLHYTEKADNEFKKMISELSYTKLMSICYRVAINTSDKVVTGEKNKRHAMNSVFIGVSYYYKKMVENDWNVKDSCYDYASDELKFFITKVLKKELSILEHVPSIELIMG